MNVTAGGKGTGVLFTVAVYVMLIAAGAVEGLIGSFQYSAMAGPVPVAALVCCVVLLATCVLAAWAMGSVSGALGPAAGWFIVSFVLSMPDSSGSVIITNTTAGQWYLYGGTLSAVIGVVASFGPWIRARGR
jgi:hypothetical protein